MAKYGLQYRTDVGFEIELDNQPTRYVTVIPWDLFYTANSFKIALNIIIETTGNENFLHFEMEGDLTGDIFYFNGNSENFITSINRDYNLFELLGKMKNEVKPKN